MEDAKIQLSQEEMALVQNAEVLLTKQRIIEKVFNLFGEMAELLQLQMKSISLPASVQHVSPKIARGENYKSLPYVMLDYPRFFSREHVLAIRTFFWWGNFFSITLQLKGIYLQQYATSIMTHRLQLAYAGFHIAVTEDEWRHDHSADHYIRMDTLDASTIEKLLQHPFCKLSARIPLTEWNHAALRFQSLYGVLTAVLKN